MVVDVELRRAVGETISRVLAASARI